MLDIDSRFRISIKNINHQVFCGYCKKLYQHLNPPQKNAKNNLRPRRNT